MQYQEGVQMAKRAPDVFPRTVTTRNKVNIASLTIVLAELSKDDELREQANKMLDRLYRKSQRRAVSRALAVAHVLEIDN
jgi:hypothetical protein